MSELLKLNVNEHVEKKNGLTYLSWAWAWAEVLKVDPKARFEVRTFGQEHVPVCYLPGDTAMVCVEVVIGGVSRECWLPVMDHRNKAIKLPDTFAINTAIMRCMTKAVSLHGLGLYIYAGEDLPESAEPEPDPKPDPKPEPRPDVNRTMVMKVRERIQQHIAAGRDFGVMEECDSAQEISPEFYSGVWHGLTSPERLYIRDLNNARQKAKA